MRVRALCRIKSAPYYLGTNDIMTVPQEVGERWVELGWAKEVGQGNDGTVAPADAVHSGEVV